MNHTLRKQQREEAILLTLKKLSYCSRSQLQRLHDLGTVRNANRVLKDMREYITSFRDGESIYYLTKEGRERVGSKRPRKKTLQARHYVMRNDLYIAEGRPADWRNEVLIEKLVKADAMYTRGGVYHFVEIDNTQSMRDNRVKLEKYRKINGVFKLVWLTTTEYRRKQLTAMSEGLNATVLTIADIK